MNRLGLSIGLLYLVAIACHAASVWVHRDR